MSLSYGHCNPSALLLLCCFIRLVPDIPYSKFLCRFLGIFFPVLSEKQTKISAQEFGIRSTGSGICCRKKAVL